MKLTSKQMISTYNIDYSNLKEIRENKILPYEKRGREYVYNITEELEQTFLNNVVLKNTSVSSAESSIEYQLGNADLELPMAGNYSFSNRDKAQKRRFGFELRDYYIQVFRRVADRPKVESSIDEIINEMLTPFETGEYVKLDFVGTIIGNKTKEVLTTAWDEIQNILDFDNNLNLLARDWYIDGVLPIELVYDSKLKDGIIAALKLDPVGLREIEKDGRKYYIYSNTYTESKAIKTDRQVYHEEQLIQVTSGKWDDQKLVEIGYLKTALKAINDLSHIENSIIKYRVTRASEKNIWNIDVGNMPRNKAEQHINTVANNVKTNLKYNTETGEVNTDVTEGITNDWIFPSRNGKQKTSVDTINGNSDFISKLEDLQYFRRELYEALKIPIGRLDGDSSLDYSGQDILREEIKFSKFIERLRANFTKLFYELLKRHVISKKIITEDDWNKFKTFIKFRWNVSNPIIEKHNMETIKTRMESFSEMKEAGIVGKVVSVEFAVKHILGMTAEEFQEEQKKIAKEKKQYKELYDDTDDAEEDTEEDTDDDDAEEDTED